MAAIILTKIVAGSRSELNEGLAIVGETLPRFSSRMQAIEDLPFYLGSNAAGVALDRRQAAKAGLGSFVQSAIVLDRGHEDEEFYALPHGAFYMGPDNIVRQKQ